MLVRLKGYADLTQVLRFHYSNYRNSVELLKLKVTSDLAKKLLTTQTRIKQMDVTSFTGVVLQAKLDVFKYVKPSRPTNESTEVISQFLTACACRYRYRKYKQTGQYPFDRIRYSRDNRVGQVTWANKSKRRAFDLIQRKRNLVVTNNIPQVARKVHGNDDWTHQYLMGRLYNINGESLVETRHHEKQMLEYRELLKANDYLKATQMRYRVSNTIYTYSDYTHDYHMGNICDASGNQLCRRTQMSLANSIRYQNRYLQIIENFETFMKRMRKREGRDTKSINEELGKTAGAERQKIAKFSSFL